MSVGKMRAFIDIIATAQRKDRDGFVTDIESAVASVRAEKEERHGSIGWANRAAFSSATTLFRLRIVPGLLLDTSYRIAEGGTTYKIHSVEDVKGRGMYYEVLAERIEPTKE